MRRSPTEVYPAFAPEASTLDHGAECRALGAAGVASVRFGKPRELDRGAIAAAVAKNPRIAGAWVFGSVARGDARADSDLDLAVLFRDPEAPGDARSLYALAADLERFSPSSRVDVVVLGPQGPVFRHRVLSEGSLVYDADSEARLDFEERTIREDLDWKPTHDIAMRSTFAGLRDRFAARPRRSER